MKSMKKYIHQVWVQGETQLPDTFKNNRALWQEAFPDFEMVLWDNESARERWPDFAEHTDTCYHHATRCDLILARALRDIGGLATGTDCVPNNPQALRQYIESHDSLLVFINQGPNASNGLQWSSTPNHPFWAMVCQHQMRSNGALLATLPPNKATGPWCYTKCLERFEGSIDIVPGETAYTKYWNEAKTWNNPEAFIDPGYARSWILDETKAKEIETVVERLKAKNYNKNLIDNELLLCKKHNLFYASCSKNACSKIKSFLASLIIGTQFKNHSPHSKNHTGLKGLNDIRPSEAYEALFGARVFRFAFVRDPYRRAISCYLNRINELGLEDYDNAEYATKIFHQNRNAILDWKKNKNPHTENTLTEITFSDFIEYICQQDYYDMDRHWAPQTDSLHLDIIKYDYIGRVENLEEDLRKILKINKIWAARPWVEEHINKSAAADTDIDEYFDNSLKIIFNRKFNADFTAYDELRATN